MNANKIPTEMSLEELIDFINKNIVSNSFSALTRIVEMNDEKYWKELEREIGYVSMINAAAKKSSQFDEADEYFIFDDDKFTFYSFSSIEELLEIYPIESLMNEYYCQNPA